MKRQSEKGLPRYLGGGGASVPSGAGAGATAGATGAANAKGSPVRQAYSEVRTRTKSYGE